VGRQPVGVAGLEREAPADPVVEEDPGPGNRHRGSKGGRQRVDEGDGETISVDDTEVGRVALRRGDWDGWADDAAIDRRGQLGGVLGGD